MEWLTLHERVMASILPKPQKPTPAVPPRFSMTHTPLVGSAVSGLPPIRCELTVRSTPDQVHACQMMIEVHTVSIVAKNTYAGKVGSRKSPFVRGRTKVRKPFIRVKMTPEMIFASRFALNGSSRDARIMAMGISIKTAEPSRAHCGRCGAVFGEPTKANRASTSAYR